MNGHDGFNSVWKRQPKFARILVLYRINEGDMDDGIALRSTDLLSRRSSLCYDDLVMRPRLYRHGRELKELENLGGPLRRTINGMKTENPPPLKVSQSVLGIYSSERPSGSQEQRRLAIKRTASVEERRWSALAAVHTRLTKSTKFWIERQKVSHAAFELTPTSIHQGVLDLEPPRPSDDNTKGTTCGFRMRSKTYGANVAQIRAL
ncbi:hypothetical protein ARMSODRAFT_983825 [Armillaria solidipes]|uniref:Uncharacterized protein n=1 Tax=Armillaria solidipes TaxID=1076256 RepID=A0A2H3AHV3_9AGAR|nr:hypothetical protein ARMSODRAFT_983825 [Armillaria solidipes]